MIGRGWLLGVLAAIILALLAWSFARSPFVERDRCLDAGGAWRDGWCEGAPVP